MSSKPDEEFKVVGLNSDIGSAKPIDFSSSASQRREDRQRKREQRRGDIIDRLARGEAQPVIGDVVTDEAPSPKPKEKGKTKQKTKEKAGKVRERGSRFSLTSASFFLMVVLPSIATLLYYFLIASPQYQVETQFSVRGINSSSSSPLGLASVLGSSVQSSDSYIVASYIESPQMVRDVQAQLGIDLRQYFAKPEIDFLYRIKPDMAIEEFVYYWKDLTDISFNSTTGNISLFVYGFSPDDAKSMADAVLKVSETLVNNLSESSRKQLMDVADQQVARAEERLRKIRQEMQKLRNEERTIDPQAIIAVQQQVTASLESQLSQFRTRLTAVTNAASADSPSAKVIKRQIKALETQLAEHKARIAPGASSETGKTDQSVASANGKDAVTNDENLSKTLTKFEDLSVEQGFATQAYTAALASLESSTLEAQKHERYFATFVLPYLPSVALYPQRLLDSFVAFLVFLALWLGCQFVYNSIRDHAV